MISFHAFLLHLHLPVFVQGFISRLLQCFLTCFGLGCRGASAPGLHGSSPFNWPLHNEVIWSFVGQSASSSYDKEASAVMFFWLTEGCIGSVHSLRLLKFQKCLSISFTHTNFTLGCDGWIPHNGGLCLFLIVALVRAGPLYRHLR